MFSQMRGKRGRKNLPAVLLAGVVLSLALPFSVHATGGSGIIVDKLYQTSRARLALARVRGDRYFKLIIASAAGQNSTVAAAIIAAGGSISDRADDVDFIEARIPLAKVEAIAGRDDVTAIAADDSVTVLSIAKPSPIPPPTISPPPVPSPSPSPAPQASPTHPPRTLAEEGPLTHQYYPQRDLGLFRLRAAHPEFDGRGTVVALLDMGPDFLLPELQHAKAADGKVVPKFLDMITGVLPNSSDDASPWVPVSTRVHAVSGIFVVKGVTYRAPRDGDFYFALAHNYYIEAVARLTKWKGKPEDARLGVLWDRGSDTVWVDTTHADDFSVAKPLTDYRVNHDYTTIAVHTDDAQARPTLGLVIQTDVAEGKVALLPALGSHATMTAGTIAANKDDGGRIEGIAPEAQILSIDEGGDFTSVINSILIAERDRRVDAVCLEIIGPLSYSWKDGRFVESVIFDRAVRKYGKPIMQPADNDFGMSRVSEPCIPADVTCVGAYENADSYRINSAVVVAGGKDHLHWVSSFGPGGNGALEPSFLMPSGWICLGLGYELGYSSKIKNVFDLPPGYGIGGGTSQATPTGAGSVAVLIGAARASGIRVTSQSILTALEWTARYIPALPAYEQGNGLAQVDAAYALLKRWNGSPVPHLSFDAPVRTTDSRFLASPNRGVGFFEREGWIAGEQGTRTIFVTRHNGARGAHRYHAQIVGDDGTFAASPTTLLPLNAAARIALRVRPQSAGAHSAILRVRDSAGAVAGETLLTVVAGEQFTASNDYEVDRELAVPRPGTASIFVTVPQGVQAFVIRIESPRDGIYFFPYEPDGMEAANRSNNLLTAFPFIHGKLQVVFRYPRPGTWELTFDDSDDDFHHPPGMLIIKHPTKVRVTSSIVGATVSQSQAGRVFTVRRALSSFPWGLQATQSRATEQRYEGRVGPGAERVYALHVPPDATGIFATLSSSAGSSPDLYLFDCTGSQCLLREKATTLGAMHRLYYDAPKSGLWKLVVDGYTVSPSGSGYELSALVLGAAPRNGSVPVFTVALPANDPDVYYNEGNGPGSGEQPRRMNLNPWVFDVLGAQRL